MVREPYLANDTGKCHPFPVTLGKLVAHILIYLRVEEEVETKAEHT